MKLLYLIDDEHLTTATSGMLEQLLSNRFEHRKHVRTRREAVIAENHLEQFFRGALRRRKQHDASGLVQSAQQLRQDGGFAHPRHAEEAANAALFLDVVPKGGQGLTMAESWQKESPVRGGAERLLPQIEVF